MQIGSIEFIGTLVGIAAAAVAGGLLLEARPLLWCSVVIGAYALHLMAMNSAEGRTLAGTPKAELESRAKALERERDELELLRRELERKAAQTEEQWALLRSMVQDRLKRGKDARQDASEATLAEHSTRGIPGGRVSRKKPETDETGGTYGRW